MKRQLNKWGEILANDMTNKDWIFQIYKHIPQPNIKNKKTWIDIFQKSHTDDQQVHEKILSILIIREMQIKNEISLHTCQNGYHQRVYK
jgi:hypothetical protein